ncbi:hypothetical protein GALMADRAFT_207970 [Galerina marginata CBS 339.88]|uniref:Uncharacterized protein n=1 Tax=Galerina marginata (strain CBS 339.88) TaxID=685588 RepID=A0A067TMH9_GALM3|nr:hypothetical protein GALMADRAFT_207970 [Galerina marginata CBS 339.88]
MGEGTKAKKDTFSVIDVSDIAQKIERSLSSAMKELDSARSHLIMASYWRDNLLSVSSRLSGSDEDPGAELQDPSRCGRYEYIATMLPVIGRDFDGSEEVPFGYLAEVFGVIDREFPHLRFSEYEKALLAFKIIRDHVASRQRIDNLQEKVVMKSKIRGFLDRLYHGTEVLHGW